MGISMQVLYKVKTKATIRTSSTTSQDILKRINVSLTTTHVWLYYLKQPLYGVNLDAYQQISG